MTDHSLKSIIFSWQQQLYKRKVAESELGKVKLMLNTILTACKKGTFRPINERWVCVPRIKYQQVEITGE